MLKLICGPSGSGKTTKLINSIRTDIENGVRCFLLVPEQQAYISEMDILSSLPSNAGLFFEIVNFSGLAEDVFSEYGGVTAVSANAGMRALLMWNTLRSLAQNLKQFGKGARSDISLTSMMLSTVDELKMAGIDAETLGETAKKLDNNPLLQKKLLDIAAVQEHFSISTRELTGDDPSDRLLQMAELLRTHRYFEGCHIYVDSFTDFTAPEYQVLREILKQADSVSITLCSDRVFSSLPHFQMASETAKRLYKIASEADVDIQKEVLEAGKLKCPKTLQIIEKDLWRFDLMPDDRTPPPMGEDSVLHMTVCNNLYEEAEAAALHILQMIRQGMHYGDIAIVARDIESYRGVIDAAMERYHIPYFLSERTDLSSKPLARLILSALYAVEKNYRAQDVMSLIKTGLTGVDLRDASLFEEYCQTWHITGSRFTEDVWSMNPDGLVTARSARSNEILEAANRVRSAVISPLQLLSAELRASSAVADRCRAVYHYLDRIGIREQLLERAKKELAANRKREAGETARLYTHMIRTLSDMVAFLPNDELSVEEFITALTLLFSSSDLGSVPNVHDCVTIGSANLMRVERIRATLLIGLCEGEFPQAVSDDGLLSDADKSVLGELGIDLGSNEKMRFAEELFYVYRAMTKPTERLYLSTVNAQPDGTGKSPSLAFSRVKFLFQFKPLSFDLERIRASIADDRAGASDLEMRVASAPSGSTLRLSQSKIKDFLECPYRYYATYVLKLRDKKNSTPTYSDDGTFLHYVFEHFLRSAKRADGTLELPANEDMERIADDILEQYLSEVCPFPVELMDSRLLHIFARLRLLALRMLRDIADELRASRFVPYAFEQNIGTIGETGIPPFVIELKDGSRVFLTGTIDRIDILEHDGHLFVRIIDYKSNKKDFKIKDIKNGTEIQLILYLFSVLSSAPSRLHAAGAQYLYATTKDGRATVQRSGLVLDDEVLLHEMDGTEEKRYTHTLDHKKKEDILSLCEDMRCAVSSIAERILAGETNKTPSEKACKYCPICTHCDRAYHK